MIVLICLRKVLIILCLFVPLASMAHNIHVRQPYNDTMLCLGSTFNLYYTTDTACDSNNKFIAQLSDAYGSFSSPMNLDTLSAVITYFITCKIPPNLPVGSGYRIRIISTSAADTSDNNGKNIRISAYPQVAVSNNGPVCPNSATSLHLYASSNSSPASYVWTGPNGFYSTSQNPLKNNPQVADSGKYTVNCTYYGCTTTDTTSAVVVQPPKIRIVPTGPELVCLGNNIGLSAKDTTNRIGVIYTWTDPHNHNSTSPDYVIYGATFNEAGKYLVTASVGSCAEKDSVYVIVLPRPDTPQVTSNSPVCLGNTLNLYAHCDTPSVTYTWSGPNAFAATQQNPSINTVPATAAGDYFVTAKHSNGCESAPVKTTVTIGTPAPKPTVNINNELCKGDKLSMSVTNANAVGIYSWSGPSFLSVGKTASISNVTAANNGPYFVVYSNLGCKISSDTFMVTVTEVPQPVVTSNSPICTGEPLRFYVQDIPEAIFKWTGPAGFKDSIQNAYINNTPSSADGDYTVTAFLHGCHSSANIHATVNPVPKITGTSSNSPVCKDDTVTLFATSDINNASFNWRGPYNFVAAEQNPRFKNQLKDSAVYFVKATAKNCTSIEDSTIVVSKPLPLPPAVNSNSPIAEGDTILLFAHSKTPGATIRWKAPDGIIYSDSNTIITNVTTDNSGTYTATSTLDGCSSFAITYVKVNALGRSVYTLYPNPNNGTFNLKGLVQSEDKVDVKAFTSTGSEIYQTTLVPIHKRIDTTLDLGNLAPGIYFLHLIAGSTKNTITISIR